MLVKLYDGRSIDVPTDDADKAKQSADLTLSLQKELWGKTEDGKIKVLCIDME